MSHAQTLLALEKGREMQELLENPLMQKFLQEAELLMERQTRALINPLSNEPEQDARLGQIIRAQIRGMKAVTALPQSLIKQGEAARLKLNNRKTEEE